MCDDRKHWKSEKSDRLEAINQLEKMWNVMFAQKGDPAWKMFEHKPMEKALAVHHAKDYARQSNVLAVMITNGAEHEYIKRFNNTLGNCEIWVIGFQGEPRVTFTELTEESAQQIARDYIHDPQDPKLEIEIWARENHGKN